MWAGGEDLSSSRAPELSALTWERRLAPFGVSPVRRHARGEGEPSHTARATVDGGGQEDLDVAVSWYGPAAVAPDRPASEATIQATSGLMQVHGRDAGRPRRLGLEVASVAAGVLAAQGTLAALVGRARGQRVGVVETSVLQAALMLVSHTVAAATTGDEWVPARPGPAPGPPFRAADGPWFEIETLDPEAWKRFWLRLGYGGSDLGWAWTLFRSRYYRGTCTLPPGLHETTAAHGLTAVEEVARECEVSLRPVRGYEEVLADLGPWPGHPGLRALGPVTPRHAPSHGAPAGELPLSGIRVVEATSRLQGPLAGLLLQMLGAEVTRVEPPGGDVGRMVPPLAGDTGSFFTCFNRGKHAVELDLGRPEGRNALAELAAGADVFAHNWRPGKAAEWGLGADQLASVNPGLVYVQASGWGERSDLRGVVGTDFLVQAHAGMGHGLNPAEEPPFPSRALLTDYMGALNTAEGMLAGLYRRERTGRGCSVETSLLGGGMALQAHVTTALAAGQEKGRQAGRPVWGPLDHPIQTEDGYLVVSIHDDADLRRLCRLCQVDPDNGAWAEVERRVVDRLATERAHRWEVLLADAEIPAAVARLDLAGLPGDARLAGLFEPIAGTCQAPTTPWRFR